MFWVSTPRYSRSYQGTLSTRGLCISTLLFPPLTSPSNFRSPTPHPPGNSAPFTILFQPSFKKNPPPQKKVPLFLFSVSSAQCCKSFSQYCQAYFFSFLKNSFFEKMYTLSEVHLFKFYPTFYRFEVWVIQFKVSLSFLPFGDSRTCIIQERSALSSFFLFFSFFFFIQMCECI